MNNLINKNYFQILKNLEIKIKLFLFTNNYYYKYKLN